MDGDGGEKRKRRQQKGKAIAADDKSNSLYQTQIKLRQQLAETRQLLRQFNAVPDDKVRFLFLTAEDTSLLYSGKYCDDKDPNHCIKIKTANHMPIDKRFYGSSSMVGSCNGLVCFTMPYTTRIEDPIYICNLKCREQIILPRFTMMAKNKNNVEYRRTSQLDGTLVNGFGYNPITDEFKVVRIYYTDPILGQTNQGRVQVYTLGSGSGWRDKGQIPFSLQLYPGWESKTKVRYVDQGICIPTRGVHANGALYWLDEGWNVVAFDLATENFSLLPTPPCFRPGETNSYLLQVVGGCLCVVSGFDKSLGSSFHKKNRLDIWSFKKENSKWGIMYIIPYHQSYEFMDVHWPITLTVSGKLLLRSDYKTLVRYDPQTEEFEKLKDLEMYDSGLDFLLIEVIPFTKSHISLEALGEKSKVMENVEHEELEYHHWVLKRKNHR